MDNKYKKADYIFINGQIITVNEQNEIVSAVVVSDNKIAYAGSDQEALTYAVPETIVKIGRAHV